MTYIRVTWKQSNPEESVILYSELDAERWETRSIEVFRNGRIGYASVLESSEGTKLSQLQIPELAEIAEDLECEPVEITPEEFEAAWARRETV